MATQSIRIHDIKGATDTIFYPETGDNDVQITSNNANIPSGVSTLKDLVDNLGGLAFESTVGTNTTTGTSYSVLRATDSVNADDSNLLATSKAVSTINSSAVKTTSNQEVAGDKVFTDKVNVGGALQSGVVIGGVNIEYDPNTDSVNFTTPSAS